jgi:hypothetical protein
LRFAIVCAKNYKVLKLSKKARKGRKFLRNLPKAKKMFLGRAKQPKDCSKALRFTEQKYLPIKDRWKWALLPGPDALPKIPSRAVFLSGSEYKTPDVAFISRHETYFRFRSLFAVFYVKNTGAKKCPMANQLRHDNGAGRQRKQTRAVVFSRLRLVDFKALTYEYV